MAARLYRVTVPVADIERGAEFYARLLDMPGERVSGMRHYFDCGGTILACVQPFDHEAQLPRPADQFRPNPDYCYFAVPNLDAMFERARGINGASVDGAIETQLWGERSFYLRDPFGNPLCFADEQTLFTSGHVE
jgi:catechol 2,3-dioxygenase-like lactoylglutathione lyase family enzyme